ncbi:SPTSB palmitoyltransferase, partial [Nothoprocta ornata]|nr:SPTSB palmitoyltransferase [Nothoprocta pentlandii]NWX98265.1 SPTSB palmitoyltransferase [Nothoprocta ornata]
VDIKRLTNYLYWLYCQYELITCSYLMEPWEKVLFYTVNVATVLTLTYAACLFIPARVSGAFRFLWHFLGNQPESTVSVMK